MSAIIRWTLWQRRWSAMWWSIGVVGFVLINMLLYPSFKDQAAELEKSFTDLPPAAVQLFGGSTDFFSPVGFLNSQIFFIMLPLLLGALAISLGASILAREEQDKTIETLLARPISRGKLLMGKVIAASLILGLVSLLATIATISSAKIVNLDIQLSAIWLACVACFLLSWCTGSIALLVTAFGRARVAALGAAALLGIGGYLIVSLSGTVEWLESPSKLFPFYYYQSESILRNTYNAVHLLYFAIVTCAAGLLSYFAFRRRDIE